MLPDEEANRRLVANVHPPDWVNPEPASRYNLVVIGAGTAGLVTAAGAAGLGAKVALVERHLMGGDCLNVGCVPSKTLLRSARAASDAVSSARFGVETGEVAVDFRVVMARLRTIRAGLSHHDSAERFRQLGVDVFIGEGRFAGRDLVDVASRRLRFKRAVIATGSRARSLPVEGLEAAGYLTNETVFSLTERPGRLALIGGGPLGCELAQAFQRLGTRVTLFEAGAHVLAREDPDAAAIVERALLDDGVRLERSVEITSVACGPEGKRIAFRRDDGRIDTVSVDEILVGVGRRPDVGGLGLDLAGVEHGLHGVTVNDALQTSNPSIYAAGDVCLEQKFTHAADAAARIVVQNALFAGRRKVSALTIPRCTYTDPEIAHVGLSRGDAEARGVPVRTFVTPLTSVDRAVTDGDEEGFVKIHVRRGSDRILGATIVARHAGDLISEITVAMAGRVGLGALANVVHPYPTQADAIRRTGDAYNRTRLTPAIRAILERWLRWTR